MNLKDYQPLAMRTAKVMPDQIDMLAHGAMGCMTEAGELAETVLQYVAAAGLDRVNCREELGDGLWFAAYTANAAGLTLQDIMETVNHPVPPMLESDALPQISEFAMRTLAYCSYAEKIGTRIKAHRYYNKPLDFEALREDIKNYVVAVNILCYTLGTPFEDVLQANINKLSKRYPDKYTDAAAIERADKVEEAGVAAIVGDTKEADQRIFAKAQANLKEEVKYQKPA